MTDTLEEARAKIEEERSRAGAIASNPTYATGEPGVPLVVQVVGWEFMAMVACIRALIDMVEDCGPCGGDGGLPDYNGGSVPCAACAPARAALAKLTGVAK